MNNGKTCLIITFNSPQVTNIPILMDIYKSRFDKIFFLIHNPDGYENALKIEGKSNYFHNFFLQNIEQLKGFDYYIFTHDDAILHPQLNKDNLWSRFSIPKDAICVRNIELTPRDSSWSWAWHGGYDVVDANEDLKNLLIELHPKLCSNYLNFIAPFKCSKYLLPQKIINVHSKPLLFGGGPNADLMFMPGQAMEDLIKNIALLNFPGFFVEIVIPMAILLTDWPIYLLKSNPHSPIHYPHRGFILLEILLLTLLNRVSFHPIKFGWSNPLIIKMFPPFYHFLGSLGGKK